MKFLFLKAEGKKIQDEFKQKVSAFDAEKKQMRQETSDVRSAAEKDTAALRALHLSELQAIESKHQASIAALQRELEVLRVRPKC